MNAPLKRASGAAFGWKRDYVGLESTADGASSWVHFLQLKIAKETTFNKSLEKLAPVIIGEGLGMEKHEHSCPKCKAKITHFIGVKYAFQT